MSEYQYLGKLWICMYAWFSALILQNIWVIWLPRHGIAESTVTKTYSNMKVRSVIKHRVPLRNHRTRWGIVQQTMFDDRMVYTCDCPKTEVL